MARRKREVDDDDAFAAAYFARKGEDPLSQAMQILKLRQGGEETVADRAFKERQQLAQEFYQRAGRDIEERRLTADEKAAADAAIARDVAAGTHQMERGEGIAREKEKEKLALSEKEKDRIAAEKKQKVSDLDTMVERGIITKEQAIPYYDKLNPEYAEVAKGIKAQADEAAFKKGMEDYGKLSPKARAKALPESFGGPEVYRKILEANRQQQAEAPRPDLAPQVGTAPVSAVGQGAVWQHQIPQAYEFPRSNAVAQTIPAVAGVTEPIPLSAPTPTAGPSFMDLVLAKLEDARQREVVEPKREWYPDLGTVPPPVGEIPPELLAQPTARPLGY